jgi:glycosyltransferase involved in cell wall biosynthesis
MKIAFITRSTLHTVHGGDTVQIEQTARQLGELGIAVDILLTNEKIRYEDFDLLHFFNITRPADILFHIKHSDLPFVISPILVDHSEFDRHYRKGVSGFLLKALSPARAEYVKAVSRWLLGKDKLRSKDYLWKGQTKSIREILNKASMILPNSESEYRALKQLYGIDWPYQVVPNGIDPDLFHPTAYGIKENDLVLCAARIEGRKNQLTLIKALNNGPYRLIIAGKPAPNQMSYYRKCKKEAARNIEFADMMTQEELASYYSKAKVHVLPSWFESCGLSSLEAGAMLCNIVITDKGFTRDYFGDDAFYCDPGNPLSIRRAIEAAAQAPAPVKLQENILQQYTWRKAAEITSIAYQGILEK